MNATITRTPPATPAPRAEVSAVTRALQAKGRAESTLRTYARVARRVSASVPDGQLTDATLADYVAQRHADGASPATIALEVAAVNGMAKSTGLATVAGPNTRAALAGARRDGAGRGRGQAAGLKHTEAHQAARMEARTGTPAALRNAALIAVMADCLLRVSEAAAIQVADIQPDADGTGTLIIRRSKTDQEAQGAVLFLSAQAMRHVQAWQEAAALTDGPLFRRIRKGNAVQEAGLSRRSVRTVIKGIIQRWAAATGLETPPRFSGHSLRVGTAQSLVAAGASVAECMQAGRWTGPRMVATYTRQEAAKHGAVARYLA